MFAGEKPTLDGTWYQVHEAINSPVPLGPIPIMIGGGGEKKTLRLMAQYADEFKLICGVDEIPPSSTPWPLTVMARPRAVRDHRVV